MKTVLGIFLAVSAIAMAAYFWYERFGKKTKACCTGCSADSMGMGGKKSMT